LAILVYDGAESGDFTAALATSGTVSVVTSPVHAGDYAYRVNPAAGNGYISFNGLANTGLKADINADTYATFWLYFTALPSAGIAKIQFVNASNVLVGRYMSVDTSGQVQLNASGTVAATLTTGVWYLVEFSVTSTTSSVSVGGAAAVTFGAGGSPYRLMFGETSGSNTFDMIADDIVLDGSVHHTTPHITRLLPTGAGTDSAWTDGTGSTYAEVDEYPPDGNTTYIQNTSGTSVAHTFTMQSLAAAGAVGAVAAVLGMAVMAESTSTTTSGRVRMRSGGTVVQPFNVDLGNTTYVPVRIVREVDPDTSAAWTTSGVNAVEIGVFKDTDSSSIRATSVYAMVLTDGVNPSVPADLVLSTSDGVSTATLLVRSPALLTLSTAAGAAAPTMALQSPALLSLAADGVSAAASGLRSPALLSMAADGLSSASALVRSPALLALSAAAGLSTAAATVLAPSLVVLSASAGVSTAAVEVITLAAGEMSLDSTIGTGSATLTVSTTSFVVPGTTAGLGAATLALQAPTQLVLSAGAGLSSAAATVISPVLLAMQSSGVGTAATVVSTMAYLIPATIDGVATAALVVISPALLAIEADGLSESTLGVTAPSLVIVSATAGISTAALAVKSPALLQLSADGLGAASIAVKSPALLSLTASGLASATALASSQALLVIAADGTSLATITELSLGPTTRVRLGGAILLRPVFLQGGKQNVVRIGGGYSNPVRIPGGF
jgi:hypothetical protein